MFGYFVNETQLLRTDEGKKRLHDLVEREGDNVVRQVSHAAAVMLREASAGSARVGANGVIGSVEKSFTLEGNSVTRLLELGALGCIAEYVKAVVELNNAAEAEARLASAYQKIVSNSFVLQSLKLTASRASLNPSEQHMFRTVAAFESIFLPYAYIDFRDMTMMFGGVEISISPAVAAVLGPTPAKYIPAGLLSPPSSLLCVTETANVVACSNPNSQHVRLLFPSDFVESLNKLEEQRWITLPPGFEVSCIGSTTSRDNQPCVILGTATRDLLGFTVKEAALKATPENPFTESPTSLLFHLKGDMTPQSITTCVALTNGVTAVGPAVRLVIPEQEHAEYYRFGSATGTLLHAYDNDLVLASATRVERWDVVTSQLVSSFDVGSFVTAIDCDSTNNCIASGSDDGILRLWDTRAPAVSAVCVLAHRSRITSLSFGGRTVWTASALENDPLLRCYACPMLMQRKEDKLVPAPVWESAADPRVVATCLAGVTLVCGTSEGGVMFRSVQSLAHP